MKVKTVQGFSFNKVHIAGDNSNRDLIENIKNYISVSRIVSLQPFTYYSANFLTKCLSISTLNNIVLIHYL